MRRTTGPIQFTLSTYLVTDVVNTAAWQAIYAPNEAEFNRIWQDVQTKAAGLGMADIPAWTTQAWNQAKTTMGKYTLYKP